MNKMLTNFHRVAAVIIVLIGTLGIQTAFGEDAKKDEDFVFEKIQEIDLTKKVLVQQTNAFIAEKFVSAKSVIELRDEELGKIVGDVVLANKDAGMFDAFKGIKTRMTFDAKDGKYRLRMSNIVATDGNYVVSAFGKLEGANRYRIEPLAKKVLEKFSGDLLDYLKKAKTDTF